MSKYDGIVTKEESKMIKNIRDNYPQTWEWMKDKAKTKQMCLSKVYHWYEEEIHSMIKQIN